MAKRKLSPALKAGPKDLSKLPAGLRAYWENKRKGSKSKAAKPASKAKK